MDPLTASGEVGGRRGEIIKETAEIKNKIHLVEGERKTVYEDCEREKEENKEKIKRMKEEIKQKRNEVSQSMFQCSYS